MSVRAISSSMKCCGMRPATGVRLLLAGYG
jgi:hypothetical protein